MNSKPVFAASSLVGLFMAATAHAAPYTEALPQPAFLPSAHFLVFGGAARPTRANLEFCNAYPQECATGTNERLIIVLNQRSWEKVVEVNRIVNRQIEGVTDEAKHGRADVWDVPGPGLREADCEEYVLEKRRRLIAAGFPASTLALAVVVDENGDGHAVLTVFTDRGDFVLDNRRPAVLGVNETGYTYVKASSPSHLTTTLAIQDVRPGNRFPAGAMPVAGSSPAH